MNRLTGEQLQHLINKYDLSIDLEEGVVVASRKNGQDLTPSTIARMLGIKEVPAFWTHQDKTVRGL